MFVCMKYVHNNAVQSFTTHAESEQSQTSRKKKVLKIIEMHFDYALMYYSVFKMFLHINFMLTTQLMPTITWAKKSPSKSTHIGSKVHIVATWGTIKRLNISNP